MSRHPTQKPNQPPYAFLFAVFISLSVVIFLLYQKYDRQYSTDLVLENTQDLPTSIPEPTTRPMPTDPIDALPTVYMPTDEFLPTASQNQVSLAPTPVIQNYQNKNDNFQVTYKSNRKLNEEKSGNINRHVFYLSSGNITIHVGTDWSWLHPGRSFSDSFLVSGQPTFVYEISSQKIVDFQKGDLNYTIQCVHNGSTSLKTECTQFLKDFKFLN